MDEDALDYGDSDAEEQQSESEYFPSSSPLLASSSSSIPAGMLLVLMSIKIGDCFLSLDGLSSLSFSMPSSLSLSLSFSFNHLEDAVRTSSSITKFKLDKNNNETIQKQGQKSSTALLPATSQWSTKAATTKGEKERLFSPSHFSLEACSQCGCRERVVNVLSSELRE